MNNKGDTKVVGTLIVLFVGVIVALAIYTGGITQNIGLVDNTITIVNQTVTFPATSGILVLIGQASSVSVITNASNVVVPTTNYTVVNYDVSTGNLRTYINASTGYYNSKSVNISYTYEPLGYAKESGTRAIVDLIAIGAVLGILAFILKKIYDDGLFDMFK